MQIIEVSFMGVRSAVIDLRHPTYPLRFRLFPMIHMGLPSFYREVGRRLKDCDLIVSEGTDRPSSTGRAFLLALRVTRERTATALIAQDIDHAALGIPVRWPDNLSGDNARHHHLSVWDWLDVVLLTPVVTVAMAMGGRQLLLRRVLDLSDDTDVPHRLFGKARDEQREADLLATLEAVHQERHGAPGVVAVVYGAAHMPTVVHTLRDRFGYRARSADWLTVIDF